jgi:hypothetical protein
MQKHPEAPMYAFVVSPRVKLAESNALVTQPASRFNGPRLCAYRVLVNKGVQ